MQPTSIASVCLLLLASRAVGHAIGENHAADYEDAGTAADRKRDASQQPRVLDMESIFAGFAKSMISRTGATSSQVQNNIYIGFYIIFMLFSRRKILEKNFFKWDIICRCW